MTRVQALPGQGLASDEQEATAAAAWPTNAQLGGAAQACARVVPRLVADVVVRERAQWCTLTSQLVFRHVVPLGF